ncbi:Methuselah-like protein 10 [Operophtera brumata]|uniref:Methuselah-like protein 10 n=1 Tax=Operophtera brumata TaxID=104452 RepID=A0A0L7KVH6_OPEBR|nr:Methuselah-like protein 10 [Operophtera brumata]
MILPQVSYSVEEKTLGGKRGLSNRLSSTRARFLAYCVYAFGIPSVLTILLISLEFSGLPPHPLMPMLRHQGCFIYGTSKLIYLYSPMLLVCLSNMVFFVLTALKINEIKKQTSL